MLNVPDAMAVEIPPSLLVFSDQSADITVLNRKTWTPDQVNILLNTHNSIINQKWLFKVDVTDNNTKLLFFFCSFRLPSFLGSLTTQTLTLSSKWISHITIWPCRFILKRGLFIISFWCSSILPAGFLPQCCKASLALLPRKWHNSGPRS